MIPVILHSFWEDSNPYVFMSQLLIKGGYKQQSYTNKFYFSDTIWLPQAPPHTHTHTHACTHTKDCSLQEGSQKHVTS